METRPPFSAPRRDKWLFALRPDAAAQQSICRLQDELGARHGLNRYRIKPENLHVTLHVLGVGDVLPETVRQAAFSAAASVAFPPFEVTFDRVRSYKSMKPKKPFVLCSKTSLERLEMFHRALGSALKQCGLPADSHFSPHLTLFWDPKSIDSSPVPPIAWTATEFVLVRSLVGQAQHQVIGQWPLDPQADSTASIAPIATRPRLTAPSRSRSQSPRNYVELHARSAFSFLRGASIPEDFVQCAMELELPAMALLDRDGVYGAPRFYSSAHENNFAIRPRVGAEITMEDGSVVPLLATSQIGYQNLCQLITEAKLVDRQVGRVIPNASSTCAHPEAARWGQRALSLSRSEFDPDPRERKRPCFATWDELARFNEGLIALTGDEEGPIRRAWRTQGPAAAAAALEKLTTIFAPASLSSIAHRPSPDSSRLFVELQRHRIRGEERENTFLRDLATAHRLPLLATGGANYAIPEHRIVADVFTCLREHTTLDAAGRRLDLNSQRHVKSAAEMTELFADLPEALANSLRLDQRLDFTLENLGYEFPTFPTPNGESMDAYLREQTFAHARDYRKITPLSPALKQQIDKELELIARLKFSGYFLIVWDICDWARKNNILVQGRGSAANSAVCYMLGITAVNPVKHRLLFDRFLNDSRVGKDGKPSWPDIDLDFPSGERREKVIQEVYARYGRRGAAMTANVISYRGRNSVREIGKVLGFGEDALDRFSSLYANGDFPQTLELQQQLAMAGIARDHPRAAAMVRLQNYIRGAALPRHLGQHSGGMVICRGQLDKVVPLEPATMQDRSICQWDKDDCENLGIVKIDFLGLGMMAVMQETIELCAKRPDGPFTMDGIPVEEPETYEKIRAADTVGVFQIESRAQMATLPRFKPRDIYDLAMQVSIVRPGPITGNLVHPLIRRRDGLEKPDYIHESVADKLEPILKRTMGVILFQEQMLEISMKLAHYTGAEAESLRRAMGFTKGDRLTKELEKLKTALRRAGCIELVVEKIASSAQSFAAYGFPESHAIGFAMIAYSSTWLKIHRPAEFYASLLNNQPMGFYSPATLLQDAKRGGRDLKANPVCVCASRWECTVEGDRLIRIGLRYVKGLREATVHEMLLTRETAPFTSLDDFLRRTNFTAAERRALAAVGALNALSSDRRTALWQVEAAWSDSEALLKHYAAEDSPSEIRNPESAIRNSPAFPVSGIRFPVSPSPLAPMSHTEELQFDFAGLGLTTEEHPMAGLRARLTDVTPAQDLKNTPNGLRVTIAGSVICRQRPGTAKGFVFISLEDETGIANAVVIPPLFERLRLTITQEPALRITGPLQNVAGVQHVKAETIEPLREADLPAQTSHDFH